MVDQAIRSHRDLIAWRKAVELCKQVYLTTSGFPADERFGLTSQMRRAAVSVPSNIAEGFCRRHRREFVRFLNIARGSLAEIDTQIVVARELNFGSADKLAECASLVNEVDRIVFGLIRSLKTTEPK